MAKREEVNPIPGVIPAIVVRIILIILGVAILSTLFFSSIGLAATNTTTIAVNVSTIAQISVTPNYLEWIGVVPGGNGTDQTITILNSGSTAFSTSLYASVNSFSKEGAGSNPLGTGNGINFAAGSYLVLKNSSDTVYHFVNRIEWNDSSLTVANRGANAVAWGFYHNKTQQWLWELSKDSGNNCSTAGGLKIQPTANLYDMSGATSATAVANSTGVQEWSTWTISSGPLVDYCIAARWNCTSIMIYRWDKNSTLPTCTKTQNLNATLAVGSSIGVTANVFIPLGTPSGNATQSTLTITAT